MLWLAVGTRRPVVIKTKMEKLTAAYGLDKYDATTKELVGFFFYFSTPTLVATLFPHINARVYFATHRTGVKRGHCMSLTICNYHF